MNINNLIIEITRKCNLKCSHCLRGNAQNLEMPDIYLKELFSQMKGSYCALTITGGEPSLNVEGIKRILYWMQYYKVYLDYFYIATNGIKVNIDFVHVCLMLYNKSNTKEICRLDLSNDRYHGYKENINLSLLHGLLFFSLKHEKNLDYYLIPEGRAKKNHICKHAPLKEYKITTQDEFNDTAIYLNCHGEIINGCDWSFVNQKKHILCRVENLTEYYNNLCQN